MASLLFEDLLPRCSRRRHWNCDTENEDVVDTEDEDTVVRFAVGLVVVADVVVVMSAVVVAASVEHRCYHY